MKILSRAKAIALRRKRYFPGTACPQGHVDWKLVVNYTCIKCLHLKHQAKRRVKRKAKSAARTAEREALNNNHRLPYSPSKAKALGLKRYFTGVACPRGHVAERLLNGSCYTCMRENNALRAKKQHKHIAELARKRRAKDLERHRKAARTRWQTDIQHKLRMRLRHRYRQALKGRLKTGSAIPYLGCSVEKLVRHLEKLFLPGMTWKNWGLHGWHIDHVKALKHFDLTDPEQCKVALRYTNLQPLWAPDNLRKFTKAALPRS